MAGRWRDGIQSGLRSAQPAFGDVAIGTLYFVTDEGVMERSTGAAWVQVAINETAHDALDHTGLTGVGGGSSLSSGTSFPGSPTTGDRFRRTDINYMVFVYDGTRWVSEQMFTMDGSERALNAGASTTSPTRFKQTPLHTLDIYAVRVDIAWFIATTNSGAAYWTLEIKNLAESTTHVTANTSAMSPNTWTKQTWTTGGVIPASDIGLMWILTKTGSPGAFTCAPSLYYRLIAT